MDFRASTAIFLTLIVGLTGHTVPSPAAGNLTDCARPSITVEAEELEDHRSICEGAKDALYFLGRLNLDLSHPLTIKAMMDLPGGSGEEIVGCYKEKEQTVFVLTFSAFDDRAVWFGMPVNRDLYRSLVTHEVAHAIAGCNFSISDPTSYAHEYVAYVTMLAAMNPDLRRKILESKPGKGFEHLSEINELTHAFDPVRFGVEAYRHYSRKEHGDAFLLKVLSGAVLTNSIHELP